MIPFSSFLQTGDMIADTGGKALNVACTGKKGSDPSAVERGGQFLAWVLESIGRLEEIRTEGQAPINVDQDDCQTESCNWDQLAALMADASAAGSTGEMTGEMTGDFPNPSGNGLGIVSELVQKLGPIDLKKGAAAHPSSGNNDRSLPGLLEKLGAVQPDPEQQGEALQKPSDGQTKTGPQPVFFDTGGKLSEIGEDVQAREPVRANEKLDERGIRKLGSVFDQPSGHATESVDDRPKEKRISPLIQKNDSASITKSGLAGRAPADGTEKPASAVNHPLSGNGLTATASEAAGLPTDSQEEDPGQFREAVRGGLRSRNEIAESNEKEEFKSLNPDAVKGGGSEPNRSVDPLQAAAKAPLTGKTTPSAPPGMNRMETPTAGTFQTTVMDQIVEKISLRSFQGRSEMQIRLKPDFLGNVQMHIAADKEQLVVRMVTDQTAVKEIVESNLHQLKAELQNQGLAIDRFDIMVTPDAEQHPNRDQFAQMFKQSPSQNQERRDRNRDSDADTQEHGRRTNEDQPDGDGINYFA